MHNHCYFWVDFEYRKASESGVPLRPTRHWRNRLLGVPIQKVKTLKKSPVFLEKRKGYCWKTRFTNIVEGLGPERQPTTMHIAYACLNNGGSSGQLTSLPVIHQNDDCTCTCQILRCFC